MGCGHKFAPAFYAASKPMLIGYAQVSTIDRILALQRHALAEAGSLRALIVEARYRAFVAALEMHERTAVEAEEQTRRQAARASHRDLILARLERNARHARLAATRGKPTSCAPAFLSRSG
jgi:hypothetical protein